MIERVFGTEGNARCGACWQKGSFQGFRFAVVGMEEGYEVQQIRVIEGPVLKPEQAFKILILVVLHEIIRCMIHSGKKLITLVDDRFALAPSQNCRNKCGNFDVLFYRKLVWNTDGVIGYESRPVVLSGFDLQKLFDF